MNISQRSQTVDGNYLFAVQSYPDRVLLRYITDGKEETLTYLQVAPYIASLARTLQQQGIKKGNHVVLYLDDIVPSFLFCLANALIGGVIVPLPTKYSVTTLAGLCKRVKPKLIFSASCQKEVLNAAGLKAIYSDDFFAPVIKTSVEGCQKKVTEYSALQWLAKISTSHHADDLYMLQPTSGSTGDFKLVMITHRHITYAADIALTFDLCTAKEPAEKILMVAHLSNGMGQINSITALTLAAELCIPSLIDVKTPLDEVRQLDPTYLCVTPRILQALYAQHKMYGDTQLFGSSAKLLTIGGASTYPELLGYVNKQGVDIIECYGATEVALLLATPRGQWRKGYIGKPLPGVDIKITKDGELLARSPSHMIGYYADQEATQSVFSDEGYYCTGDIFEVGKEGYFRFIGRKKDVFHTLEYSNIYPERIEAIVEGLPGVRQAVLIGDQKPYVTVLMVIENNYANELENGYLDPEQFIGLYKNVGKELKIINETLEPFERIEAFSLLSKPISSNLYSVVGQSKIRREREKISAHYAALINVMYTNKNHAIDSMYADFGFEYEG